MPKLVSSNTRERIQNPLEIGSLKVESFDVSFSYPDSGFDRATELALKFVRTLDRAKNDASAREWVRDEFLVALIPVINPFIDSDGGVKLDVEPNPLFIIQTKKGKEWAIDKEGGLPYNVESRTYPPSGINPSRRRIPDILARFNLTTGEANLEGLEQWLPKGGLPVLGRKAYQGLIKQASHELIIALEDELPIGDVSNAYMRYRNVTDVSAGENTLLDIFLARVGYPGHKDLATVEAMDSHFARYENISGLSGVAHAFAAADSPVLVAVHPDGGTNNTYTAYVIGIDNREISLSGIGGKDASLGLVLRLDPNGLLDSIVCQRGVNLIGQGKSGFDPTRPGDGDFIERRANEIAGKVLNPLFGSLWTINQGELLPTMPAK